MCFPTPWIFPERYQLFPKSPLFWFSKIHVLKLWTSPKDPQPLVSKTLKVLSFGFHEIHQVYPTNGSKNAYIVFRSGQNRVTFSQIVTCLVRTTQDTTNLILKTCPASRKSCHVFPKSCHDWTLRKHANGMPKLWHVTQIVSRFGTFSKTHFWVTSQ